MQEHGGFPNAGCCGNNLFTFPGTKDACPSGCPVTHYLAGPGCDTEVPAGNIRNCMTSARYSTFESLGSSGGNELQAPGWQCVLMTTVLKLGSQCMPTLLLSIMAASALN